MVKNEYLQNVGDDRHVRVTCNYGFARPGFA